MRRCIETTWKKINIMNINVAIFLFFNNINIFLLEKFQIKMSPIFKCLICRKDIERSTKTFWKKKGHLLCSTCLDNIDKNTNSNKVNI